MADIPDITQTNPPAPVPPVPAEPPAEPVPEPPVSMPTEMPAPPPPPSESLIVPPPEEVKTPEPPPMTEEAKPSEPSNQNEPKKKRLNPAVIITGIILLLFTLPIAFWAVSHSTEIRNFAKAGEVIKLNSPKAQKEYVTALENDRKNKTNTAASTAIGQWAASNQTSKDAATASNAKAIVDAMNSARTGGTSGGSGSPGGGTSGGATPKAGATIAPSSNTPGISTTGGAFTQITTFTGDHVCDMMASGCSAGTVQSVTVTQNYNDGTLQYSVIYKGTAGSGPKAVTTTVKGQLQTDGTVKNATVIKQETLQNGKTTIDYSASSGVSTTGGASTQTTTYTGSRVCDLMRPGTGCDSTKVKSITVTQNFSTGLNTYVVIYADKAVTYTIRNMDGLVLKVETLQNGKTTVSYDSSFADTFGKRCSPGSSSGCATGQSCSIGAVCSGTGCTNDGQCGSGRCGSSYTCEPKPVPETLFYSPPMYPLTGGPTPPPNIFKQPDYSSFGGTTPAEGGGGGGGGTAPTSGTKRGGGGTSGSGSSGNGSDGSDGGEEETTPTDHPRQCVSIVAYKGGNALSSTELAALAPGDTITLAYAPGGSATKVRFKVNDGDWNETTARRSENNSQFVWDYTLTDNTSFSIEAQWYSGTSWRSQ